MSRSSTGRGGLYDTQTEETFAGFGGKNNIHTHTDRRAVKLE